ncbi:TlpA disulfide reductase family protein [Marinoscillum sp. MHG1-6]|uniref:TlpA family protein disulfide reductase n=1 Tax=Marinoscillum sp. MHG1-6 TaxID=2959627 RepID=UPI002157EAF6|nr:TlpA disulfide reductase family protein [Marinoscillum sp. MHG1-6]
MMKITGLSVLILLLSLQLKAQSIVPIKLDELSELSKPNATNLSVINFWASWCGPCVKELPYFDNLSKKPNVDVYLVSVDFIQDKAKAEMLLQKKNIKSQSYLLDEKNFVEQIDKTWSGAIPATLIVASNGSRYFYEKSFSEAELEELVNNITSK